MEILCNLICTKAKYSLITLYCKFKQKLSAIKTLGCIYKFEFTAFESATSFTLMPTNIFSISIKSSNFSRF